MTKFYSVLNKGGPKKGGSQVRYIIRQINWYKVAFQGARKMISKLHQIIHLHKNLQQLPMTSRKEVMSQEAIGTPPPPP